MNTEIKLDYPIEVDGQTVDTLKMRRAKVCDQEVADRQPTPVQQEIALFSNLCEVEPAAIRELDLLDYQKIQETYKGFLSPKKS